MARDEKLRQVELRRAHSKAAVFGVSEGLQIGGILRVVEPSGAW